MPWQVWNVPLFSTSGITAGMLRPTCCSIDSIVGAAAVTALNFFECCVYVCVGGGEKCTCMHVCVHHIIMSSQTALLMLRETILFHHSALSASSLFVCVSSGPAERAHSAFSVNGGCYKKSLFSSKATASHRALISKWSSILSDTRRFNCFPSAVMTQGSPSHVGADGST